jgi:hypothetical protein
MLRGKAVLVAMLFGLLGGMNSMIASADFFGGDDCPPWEYDCNDWPEWTPMYWMEEMENEWDDDYYGPYGYGPYGYPGYGYGYPGYGYGAPGYGYGAPGYGPGYYGGYAPYYPRW